MTTYTITLSTAENDALAFVAVSQQEWLDNAAHERARIAIEEIVVITVQKCLETNTPIPASKDDMVELAFERAWVKTAAQRQIEAEEQAAALTPAAE